MHVSSCKIYYTMSCIRIMIFSCTHDNSPSLMSSGDTATNYVDFRATSRNRSRPLYVNRTSRDSICRANYHVFVDNPLFAVILSHGYLH